MPEVEVNMEQMIRQCTKENCSLSLKLDSPLSSGLSGTIFALDLNKLIPIFSACSKVFTYQVSYS